MARHPNYDKNTNVVCFFSFASWMLELEKGFKIIDVLFMNNTGTAGTVCNFEWRSLSWVAMMYLELNNNNRLLRYVFSSLSVKLLKSNILPITIHGAHHWKQTIRTWSWVLTMTALMNTEALHYFHGSKYIMPYDDSIWRNLINLFYITALVSSDISSLQWNIPNFSVSKTIHCVVRNLISLPRYLGISSFIWIRFCNEEV